ncbi:histone acetyltransferase [Streptococcus dysgalactiae]|nr:histone acetyltransferase [Streptococcus dysgalactiae]
MIYDDADDWPHYGVCVLACQERGISSVLDLKEAIVNQKTYQNAWIGFCQQLSQCKTESRSNTDESDLEKS